MLLELKSVGPRVEVPAGKHPVPPRVVSQESSFADTLIQSGDPWRFSPLQLRKIWDVGTRVNVDRFASLLQGYDDVESKWVLHGLREGFPIGIPENGPFPPERIWADSSVPDDSKVVIEDFFDTERKAGRIYGPFKAPMVNTGMEFAPTLSRLSQRVRAGVESLVTCHLAVLFSLPMVSSPQQLGVPNTRPFWR